MFHECRCALMLSRPWIAPMRHVCRREKEQCRRTAQFYPTVQSAAARSELLTPSERDRPEEDASFCDPDKGPTERQDSARSSESYVLLGECNNRLRFAQPGRYSAL